jgi:hypothetical protein
MNGYELAVKINDHLKSTFPTIGLTIGDSYWDNALWHARINGCIAEAGVKSGFRLELGRKLMPRKNANRIDFSDFLKMYCALYDKHVGTWERFGERSSTEIDLAFLDVHENSPVALCEYENQSGNVKDNVVKFKALHSFDSKRFRPELCLIGFWTSARDYVGMTLRELTDLITKMAASEEATYHGEKVYQFCPLTCYWLLFALFKDEPTSAVKCLSTILDPDANKLKEEEFDIGLINQK